MINDTYLSPLSISKIETKEIKETWGERNTRFRIVIYSHSSNGSCTTYTLEFNLTKEGFQIKKEKIDPIVNKLLEIMRFPLTCGTVIKLTYDENSYFTYNIEFI